MAAYSDAQRAEAQRAVTGPFQPYLSILGWHADAEGRIFVPQSMNADNRRRTIRRFFAADRFGRFYDPGVYNLFNMPGQRHLISGRLGAEMQAVALQAQNEYIRTIVNLVTRLRLWLVKARASLLQRQAYNTLSRYTGLGMIYKRRRM